MLESNPDSVDAEYDETTLSIVHAIREVCKDFDDGYW
jgi:hypothetical protein